MELTPALIALIVEAGLKYGPPLALDLVALFKKKDATLDDIETLFRSIPTYESYGIPDVVVTTKAS